MKIGVAKEIKTDEYRVALTPAGARELAQHGHDVFVETMAGEGSAFADSDYERAVLWIPDPNSPAGWIRRKVWSDEPKRKKPPMGFGVAPRRQRETDADESARSHA